MRQGRLRVGDMHEVTISVIYLSDVIIFHLYISDVIIIQNQDIVKNKSLITLKLFEISEKPCKKNQ